MCLNVCFTYKLLIIEVELSDEEAVEEPEAKISDTEEMPAFDEELLSDEDDLNDYNKLKAKAELKAGGPESPQKGMTSVSEIQLKEPKHLYREEVIDDFIRNFLKKYNMSETLNIFQVIIKHLDSQ